MLLAKSTLSPGLSCKNMLWAFQTEQLYLWWPFTTQNKTLGWLLLTLGHYDAFSLLPILTPHWWLCKHSRWYFQLSPDPLIFPILVCWLLTVYGCMFLFYCCLYATPDLLMCCLRRLFASYLPKVCVLDFCFTCHAYCGCNYGALEMLGCVLQSFNFVHLFLNTTPFDQEAFSQATGVNKNLFLMTTLLNKGSIQLK